MAKKKTVRKKSTKKTPAKKKAVRKTPIKKKTVRKKPVKKKLTEKDKQKKLLKLKAEYAELKLKFATVWYEGWKKFTKNGSGVPVIRCQAVARNKDKKKSQCGKVAIKGRLFCQVHSPNAKPSVRQNQIEAVRKDMGLYDIKEKAGIFAEMQKIKDVPDEKFEDVTDELKLAIGILRKYIMDTDEKKLMKQPSRLFWLIDNIVRFKQTQWSMKHAKEVSFSREQVAFMFNQIRVIIINNVKDTKQVEKIGDEISGLGQIIQKNGFN